MYSESFSKVYNEFGWNYAPEAFGEKLLTWIREKEITVETSMDLACGTGILCEILDKNGIQASGMDFSEGMIAIARERNPKLDFEVADMIQFCPRKQFDLVTCTGDALNHILNIQDVEQIFKNVYSYLKQGGFFIFDILNEENVDLFGPIDLDFSEEVKAQFTVSQDEQKVITLATAVFENGKFQFEEKIREIPHDPVQICQMLEDIGFQILRCADQLLEEENFHGNSWFIVAQKEKGENGYAGR